MSRQSKREKSEQKLSLMEADFVSLLTKALRECSEGQWGLFGHNEYLEDFPHLNLVEKRKRLCELGDEIVYLREELGIAGEFRPLSLFTRYSTMRGSNVKGEPKLAKAMLNEINGN